MFDFLGCVATSADARLSSSIYCMNVALFLRWWDMSSVPLSMR